MTTLPAAQLIVDAARLVPLGADNKKPSGVNDLLMFLSDLRAKLFDKLFRQGLLRLRVLILLSLLLGEVLRKILRVAAENDVRSPPGHVRRNRNRLVAPGLRDDVRLKLMVLGIQDFMLNTLLLEHRRKQFGLLDRDRSDKNRLPLGMARDDLLDNRRILLALAAIDAVRVIRST